MKILITGANGFLGYYLVNSLLARRQTVMATGKGGCRLPFTGDENFSYTTMDFTDPFAVHDVFEKTRPDVVLHAGAMGRPDECETNQMEAYITNVEGTVTLLINAAEFRSFFVFLSTDFVFNGEKGLYTEDDQPDPVNYYGRTKLEAEEGVREYEHEWAIVRTVLVYGRNHSGRKNFVELVRDKLEKGESYRLVDDQVRTPTYVEDLSDAIVSIIERRKTGLFHVSGDEVFTPYQMGKQIAALLGLEFSSIVPVDAGTFKEKARRPLRTGFDIKKAKQELGFKPITFSEGLKKTFSG